MRETLQDQPQQTLDGYVQNIQRQGYRIVYQAEWANGAGWIALAGPDTRHNRISLLVKFYSDGRYTSELLGSSLLAASA
jgi:DNA-binding winged helix-turn-helix (wHTH) protein